MPEALDLLWLPAAAAVLLVGVHAYFGLQVLARGVIFVDLALAQIAALGATVAFLLGHAPQTSASYAYSLAFTLLGAVVLSATRTWSARVSQEALIGVIYVVSAAAAFLLVDKAPQGTEHIKQVLTGNILTVRMEDVLLLAPLYALISFGYVGLARWRRADHWGWDLLFFACLGVVVTSSVALAGVLLVFSFLIIPAAIGVILADRFGRQLRVAWIAGTLASLGGLAASYFLDLPTGAAIVCAFGVALALVGLAHTIRHRRWIAPLRWTLAGVLALSAVWMVLAPRADHVLLDALEALAPSLRAAYTTAAERERIDETSTYAEQYRRQADALNAVEVQSRAAVTPLDDEQVRRIAVFLRSYNEMRRGEQFVEREVRARARTRNRWWIGLVMASGALLAAPGLIGGALRLRKARA